MSNETTLVMKRRFAHPSFLFESSDIPIPITLGFETYGALNNSGDNAILVCHPLTTSGHAAGRYAESAPAPGWWDELIGPRKPLDTERYCVVSIDSLANVNAILDIAGDGTATADEFARFNFQQSNVITTGPSTINPATGAPYGMSFPVFSLADQVRLQRELLRELGVHRLKAVIGPSMGGAQAFLWAKLFPDYVDRIISVLQPPRITPHTLMWPFKLSMDAIRRDPKWNGGDYYGRDPPGDGLKDCFLLLLLSNTTHEWTEAKFGRAFADTTFTSSPDPRLSLDGRFHVDEELEKTVAERVKGVDANSYLYLTHAHINFDICEPGESYEDSLRKLSTPVLMLIDESDVLSTPAQAAHAMKYLPSAETFVFNSHGGHLSCLFGTHHFAEAIRDYLARP